MSFYTITDGKSNRWSFILKDVVSAVLRSNPVRETADGSFALLLITINNGESLSELELGLDTETQKIDEIYDSLIEALNKETSTEVINWKPSPYDVTTIPLKS